MNKSAQQFFAIASALFLAGSLVPARAEALVGVVSGGSLIPGLVVIGATAVTAGPMAIAGYGQLDVGLAVTAEYLGAGGLLLGLVILDSGSNVPSLQYTVLSPGQAESLGILPEELERYNEELPEINAIAQQVARDLARSGRVGTVREAIDASAADWSAYGATLSPESMAALGKIGVAAARAGT